MRALESFSLFYHTILKPISGSTHEERLESFYSEQASIYDSSRKKMLHGKEQLFRNMPLTGEEDLVIEMGGGTGEILDFCPKLRTVKEVLLVDLSNSLLHIARQRIEKNKWLNARAIHSDVCKFKSDKKADLIIFSYSLSMIPNWFEALKNADSLLKTGGHIGITDFYISKKHPENLVKHNFLTRLLIPAWFQFDNVFPSPDHLPFLMTLFEKEILEERFGSLPYIPLIKIPYYVFVGRKTG